MLWVPPSAHRLCLVQPRGASSKLLEPTALEPKWLEPKWLRQADKEMIRMEIIAQMRAEIGERQAEHVEEVSELRDREQSHEVSETRWPLGPNHHRKRASWWPSA